MNIEEKFEAEISELRELAQENNKILHKLNRHMRIGFYMRILYWVLIIGATIGAFVFLKPFVDSITNIYSGTFGVEPASEYGTFGSIKDLIKNLSF
jgi:F0F1-type ATP synthase beta subunit